MQKYKRESTRKHFNPKKCAICGNEFKPITSLNKYCSHGCKYQADLQARSKKPKYKKCQVCGGQFRPYTSLDKFCSANCRVEHQKNNRPGNRKWNDEQVRRRMGKNNPAYRNGNYVKGFKQMAIGQRKFTKNSKAIKQEMIDSLGYVYCEFCGTSNSLKFEAHHIVYRSEKPGHKNLHDKRNILITCIECHNKLHKNKDSRNYIVAKRRLTQIFGKDIIHNG